MGYSLRFAAAVMLAAALAGVVHAAQSQTSDRMMMNPDMMKMMVDMKAADAKLDALVQAMNAAKGPEKVDAIAAVVTALVNDRRAMHNSMGSMMSMMQMMHDAPSHDEHPAGRK